MPTFPTSEPVAVTVEIAVGDVRIDAGDRTDAVVEVRPRDAGKKADVAAAEQTKVDFSNGRLVVKEPRTRKLSFRGGPAIDVHVMVPAGSTLRLEAGVAEVRCRGPLGECRLKVGVGDIQLEEAGPVHLTMGAGGITVGRATGHAEITNGSGAVRVEVLDGTGVVRNSNGATSLGEVTGDLRVKAANGNIAVERSRATLAAKTAHGDIRLGEVTGGVVVAETGCGTVEVGIPDGVAAWLDLGTRFGTVRNELGAADPPAPGEATVEVRADSGMGDITVRRSSRHDAAAR
jgi:hypothetical protein